MAEKKFVICRNICYALAAVILLFFIVLGILDCTSAWNYDNKIELFDSFGQFYLHTSKATWAFGLCFGSVPFAVGLWAHWEIIDLRKCTSN